MKVYISLIYFTIQKEESMNNFHRKMAYQVCIVELLALDFDELKLTEIVANHAQEMRDGFEKGIPYYKLASAILGKEYHNVALKEGV